MSPDVSTNFYFRAHFYYFIHTDKNITALKTNDLIREDKRGEAKFSVFSLSLSLSLSLSFSTWENNHSARLENKFLQRISGHRAPVHNEQPLIRRKLNSLFENGVQGKTNAGITKCPASRIERDTLAGQLFCLRYVVIVPRINGVLESPWSAGSCDE